MTAAPPPPVVDQRPAKRRTLLWVGLGILIPVVSVVVIGAVVLQLQGWRAFRQPSGSMMPNLLIGDNFFVDREAYADGRRPVYGDVIVFLVPAQMIGLGMPADAATVPFVKRVVGLPGDRLSLNLMNGALTINGKAVPRQPAGEFTMHQQKAMLLREQFPNGAMVDVLQYAKLGPLGTRGPYVVPAEAYFVMGDNRDDSLDSRNWNKGAGWAVPLADIIGRANYIYWSGFERLGRIGVTLK